MFVLEDEEADRLKQAIQAAWALPFIDDIEDFIWEAIFAYTKGLPLSDPLQDSLSKKLFDLLDPQASLGWSLKAIQWTIHFPLEFELVIQRADILKKHLELGFSSLSLDSDPNELGAALLRHWYDKVDTDALQQGVHEKRVAILLKSPDRRHYVLYEGLLREYSPSELAWTWTDDRRSGLQARSLASSQVIFRWYPNQKQLFERFRLEEPGLSFNLEPRRLPMARAISLLLQALDGV
jgi:hypothetical protein